MEAYVTIKGKRYPLQEWRFNATIEDWHEIWDMYCLFVNVQSCYEFKLVDVIGPLPEEPCIVTVMWPDRPRWQRKLQCISDGDTITAWDKKRYRTAVNVHDEYKRIGGRRWEQYLTWRRGPSGLWYYARTSTV